MQENLESIYAKIPESVKMRAKKQAIDLRIDFKDYIAIAITHFADHIEKNEIDFHEKLFG
jgi:hypothetical protein